MKMRIARTTENCARVLGIIKKNGDAMTCREIVQDFTGKCVGSGGYSGVAGDISDILSWLCKQGYVSKIPIMRGHERYSWGYLKDMPPITEKNNWLTPGYHKLSDFTAILGERNRVNGLYTLENKPVTLRRADGRVVVLPMSIETIRKGLRNGGWSAEW